MSLHPRERLSLDGRWELELLDGDDTDGRPEDVIVPGAWTAQIAGHGDSHESVRYRRTFDWTPGTAGVHLVFNGVNHSAEVRLNGTVVGTHVGAWEAFSLDVSDVVIAGTNSLDVIVAYPPRTDTDAEPGYLEVPHGKQSWYGTSAGIWQSVFIETRPLHHIAEIEVRADAPTGTIDVRAIASLPGARAEVTVSHGDEVVARAELPEHDGRYNGTVVVPDVQLWGIDQPALYTVTLRLEAADGTADVVSRSTGFRTIEARDGAFFLNGHELEVRAVLDQDYHPSSAPIPESTEEWEELLYETRALGFNMLRVHIKRPDPRYYEIADRMGMLVWTELPSWMVWTQSGADEGLAMLERFIAADQHHPSIVMWTIINESWGLDMTSGRQRRWLADAFHRIKAVALGSLVVDNSACFPNFHMVSDVDDYHVYRGIPESRREWDEKIEEFAARPDWTYSGYGDAERSGTEPLMLSEFGNWALPVVRDQYTDGAEPWWFGLGANWAYGAAEGTRLMERFAELGLDRVFGTWEDLVAQLHHAQLVANRYQTTSIRMQPSISGYVLTQLSDVQWEANGLFDMNRTPKTGTAEFALANGDRAIALRPDAYSAVTGDSLALSITTVPARTGSAPAPVAGTVRVLLDGVEIFTIPDDAERWSTARMSVPVPSEPGQYELAAELVVNGEVAARDAADLVVVAPVGADAGRAVVAADSGIADWARSIGLGCDAELEPDSLLVTTVFDAAARAHASDGGRVLVLVEEPDALDGAFDLLTAGRIGPRSGDGDWVPRSEWLDRSGPFQNVPGSTLLGIAFEDLLGEHVLTGIPNAIRSARVYSGIFSGWLRGAATTTATVRWSEGSVTLTTLRLRHAQALSPVAATLARAVVDAARLG
ncbi:glycoside hydrolase family 2 protein [Mycetocola zhujimingii]|uniref:glycoside hydrolase family 2 protein n=1 Tax=Mycetocola zhujimingii TaxID=2079792 RepID=UPI000D3AFF06|nr:sugar-binding domain-containing protein [Mycetocola zhujimingii]AWB87468.1 hypothetical protein C3E77_13220 [Mycetocola zhujimingii]